MKTHLLTSNQSKKISVFYTMWIGTVSKKRIYSSPESIFSTPTKPVVRLKREISCLLFSTLWVFKIITLLIYQTKNLHVTGYGQVSWSKFRWWWLMKQIRGTRMYIILQMKTHLLTSKESKKYHMYHNNELERLTKNKFSARQNELLVHHKNLTTD
jgi:hypothetical protein